MEGEDKRYFRLNMSSCGKGPPVKAADNIKFTDLIRFFNNLTFFCLGYDWYGLHVPSLINVFTFPRCLDNCAEAAPSDRQICSTFLIRPRIMLTGTIVHMSTVKSTADPTMRKFSCENIVTWIYFALCGNMG